MFNFTKQISTFRESMSNIVITMIMKKINEKKISSSEYESINFITAVDEKCYITVVSS